MFTGGPQSNAPPVKKVPSILAILCRVAVYETHVCVFLCIFVYVCVFDRFSNTHTQNVHFCVFLHIFYVFFGHFGVFSGHFSTFFMKISQKCGYFWHQFCCSYTYLCFVIIFMLFLLRNWVIFRWVLANFSKSVYFCVFYEKFCQKCVFLCIFWTILPKVCIFVCVWLEKI